MSERLPEATLRRLSLYLRTLTEWSAEGIETASSAGLAGAAGTSPATLRKDLSLLGSHGRPGVGYSVAVLRSVLEEALGLDHAWRVAILGAGHLGRALAGYTGFGARGFEVVAMLDAAPEVIGTQAAGQVVADVAALEEVIARLGVTMVVLTVPAAAAQGLVDRVAAAGVRSVLSFAPVAVKAPEGVVVNRVDLST